MTRTVRATRRIAVALAGLTLAAGAAGAQPPFDQWGEPVVVELDLVGGTDRGVLRQLRGGRITLGPNESFLLEIDPFDQRGRRFPRDRFLVGVDLDPECDGRLEVDDLGSGDLRFSAGRGRGRCRVIVWVPGNLNLERELEFEVTGLAETGYTRRQAEVIAERLYRAILQREIEAGARSAAVAEIQRGRLANQVGSMLGSQEFAAIRQRSQPTELLDAFYAGLLERTPDSAGINDYLREIRRNRFAEAILNLVRSVEFEASLPER